MTNMYQLLSRLGKEKVIEFGKFYAVDKEGFEKFVEENWVKNEFNSNGEYVIAVVSIAMLLKDGEKDCEHELYMLDRIFNNSENEKDIIVNALDKYFNEKNLDKNKMDIVKSYREKIEIKEEMDEILRQLENLSFLKINPILGEEQIKKLKEYNNQEVYVEKLIDGKIKPIEKLSKVTIKGSTGQYLILKIGKINYKFLSTKRGVYALRDCNKKLIFKDTISLDNTLSDIEKVAYLYGVEAAKKYANNRISELNARKTKSYRECLARRHFEGLNKE